MNDSFDWRNTMLSASDIHRGVPASIVLGWILALGCLVPSYAFAHTSLEAYVRETIGISVGGQNIDIKIQFSFPSELSLKERRTMDRDGNGKLSKEEKALYLDGVQRQVDELLQLSINGKRAALIPLADPEIDLEDAPDVEKHLHELRLSYFARVPQDFGVGSTIALDSGLWTIAPLMVSVATEGVEGVRFHATDKKGLRPPSKTATVFRVVEARCTRWENDSRRDGTK